MLPMSIRGNWHGMTMLMTLTHGIHVSLRSCFSSLVHCFLCTAFGDSWYPLVVVTIIMSRRRGGAVWHSRRSVPSCHGQPLILAGAVGGRRFLFLSTARRRLQKDAYMKLDFAWTFRMIALVDASSPCTWVRAGGSGCCRRSTRVRNSGYSHHLSL
jgi:hypothetical protein